jgi:hypothetical protein
MPDNVPVPAAAAANPSPADPSAAIQAAAATLADLVEAIRAAVSTAAPQPDPAPAAQPAADETSLGSLAATLAASPVIRKSVLTSSRLWTMVGTVSTLAAQQPLGLQLPPIAQVCIAGVAAIYIAARTIRGSHHTGV